MRCLQLLLASLAIAVAPALAQAQASSRAGQTPPPPMPDAKPPAMEVIDDSVEPQVTIKKRETDTVEEYRVNGRLYKVKVIPLRGEPYYLIDQKGDGSFVRQEGPGTPSLSIPMWVIGTF